MWSGLLTRVLCVRSINVSIERKASMPSKQRQALMEIQALIEENEILRQEIRVSRESAEITATLVVRQFEETEKILRRFQVANEQRKAVLDSATQLFIIATDENGIIIVFNKGAENLIGYSADDVIGKETPEIFHLKSELDMEGENLSLSLKTKVQGIDVFWQYARHGITASQEWTYVKKDGTHVPVSMSISSLYDPEGAVGGFLCIASDITEKKLSEQALFESEEKYRSLFDSGPNPIFVLHMKSLAILDVNPSAEEVYGYSRTELLGRPFTELGEFEGELPQFAQYDKEIPPESCFVSGRARHLKKDRTPIFLRIKACPINYKEERAIILAVTDITELIEKDAQLFQASKMTTLGEMSSGIAHELSQPLNAIKIGNEYLKLATKQKLKIPDENLIEVTTQVSEQVDRASEIINGLREFGRPPDFKREQVNINGPVRKVLSIIGQQFVLQNIHVELDLDDDLPMILANNNKMEQVFFNMLTNAKDAIEQKRCGDRQEGENRITIKTFAEKNDVAFTICDTGIGIQEEILDKIYEPFFTTKEVGKGMGLGLSIVHGIVRSYGGKVEIETTVGEGSCFKYTFPAHMDKKEG